MNQNPEQLARDTIDLLLAAAGWPVLIYFDVFPVGLTIISANRTFGYFDRNGGSNYGYKKTVTGGVLAALSVSHRSGVYRE